MQFDGGVELAAEEPLVVRQVEPEDLVEGLDPVDALRLLGPERLRVRRGVRALDGVVADVRLAREPDRRRDDVLVRLRASRSPPAATRSGRASPRRKCSAVPRSSSPPPPRPARDRPFDRSGDDRARSVRGETRLRVLSDGPVRRTDPWPAEAPYVPIRVTLRIGPSGAVSSLRSISTKTAQAVSPSGSRSVCVTVHWRGPFSLRFVHW